MRLKDKLCIVRDLVRVRFFGARIPIAVRIQLTNRCPLQCLYCAIWKTPVREMTTEDVCHLIEELAEQGTKIISFSGGEPMIRDDFGHIIDHAIACGIRPEINSTGLLIPQKRDQIRKLRLIKFSLDGTEEVHDRVRGKGSYAAVLRAAGIAREEAVPFTFATTLTRFNLDSIDHLLSVAQTYDTLVAFQPLKLLYRGVDDMSEIQPERKDYRNAIQQLIDAKRSGNRHIRNSMLELSHILEWPRYKKIPCWAGRIFCIIDTGGELYPCDRPHYDQHIPNCIDEGFKKAFASVPPVHCSGCGFCGTLELNLLMNFQLGILGTLHTLMKK